MAPSVWLLSRCVIGSPLGRLGSIEDRPLLWSTPSGAVVPLSARLRHAGSLSSAEPDVRLCANFVAKFAVQVDRMQVGRVRRLDQSLAPADQAGLGCGIGVSLASCFRFWATAARRNSPAPIPLAEASAVTALPRLALPVPGGFQTPRWAPSIRCDASGETGLPGMVARRRSDEKATDSTRSATARVHRSGPRHRPNSGKTMPKQEGRGERRSNGVSAPLHRAAVAACRKVGPHPSKRTPREC